MNSDRWQRIQEVFHKASARPPDQRESVVAEACGDDEELRAEVASLLAHDARAEPDFMRLPDSEPVDSSPVDAFHEQLIGKRVSRYEIKRVIATGGMGTVYAAEQDNPQRLVALKVMRVGITSRYALRHFEYESRILARLRHPNIAQVYEAGTFKDSVTGGLTVPYFAMEYIPDARPISDYADGESLKTDDRLELFGQVCHGVHHGHQKSVIHRDLKPANILVDGAGQVKIIDFGVARSTDSDVAATTLRTDVGQLVGTLKYMSPEQFAADPLELDIRSDVYALGVVLYELVCGRLPYEVGDTSIAAMARAVCDARPIPPRTFAHKVSGDLEIILLKALEKDRDKRYQSASELGSDLQRFLTGEPIAAKPPTMWTRAAGWVRRRPYLSTAIGCAAMIAVVAVATYLTVAFVNARPYKIEIADQDRIARLLARSGRILHEWQSEEPGAIPCAKLVRRPSELGGGFLAVVGFGLQYGGPYGGKLCAFDAVRDLETPLWMAGIETQDIPQENRGFDGSDFHPGAQLLVRDIFPEWSGDEIVTVFPHVFSRRSIRVYDLSGELQYEAWHHGGVADIHWLPGPRVLVCVGDSTTLKRDGPHKPITVYALQPRRGVRVPGFVNPELSKAPPTLVWYRYLVPFGASDAVRLVPNALQVPSSRRWSEKTHVELVLGQREGRGGMSWVIDPYGNDVPDSRIISDAYNRNRDRLPDPETIRLAARPYPESDNSD